MIMGTKMYGLVTFDWKGRNWKEGRWGQRLSTCCIHAALVFCESCRGGVAAEQLLSAATERSSCANSCLWAEPLRPRGPAWWHWGDTVGEQKQGIFCPSYSQRCLVSRNQDFGQDAVLWGRNEKAGYFVLICMLIHFCWKFVWLP